MKKALDKKKISQNDMDMIINDDENQQFQFIRVSFEFMEKLATPTSILDEQLAPQGSACYLIFQTFRKTSGPQKFIERLGQLQKQENCQLKLVFAVNSVLEEVSYKADLTKVVKSLKQQDVKRMQIGKTKAFLEVA